MQKIALLGCGRVSQRHMEVCRDELKNAQVVAVCDPVKALADKRAQELKAEALYDMDALLARTDVDAVVILTESGNHEDHARRALGAGKHVIVEKPAAMTAEAILANQQLAADKQLMYAPILQNRYNPATRAVKSAMDKGRFGKLTLATIRLRWCRYQDYYEDGWHGTWKMDGGVINQQALHHLDALQWVCGPIDEVVAAQANALNKLEAEDTTVATVRFKGNFLGVIEATTAARPEDFEASLSVVGEKGIVVIDGIALNKIRTWRFVEEQPEDAQTVEAFSQEVPTGYGLSHGPLLQDIVDRLNEGRLDPPITGEDATHAVRLVHALYRSTETGGWIKMDDKPQSQRLGQDSKQLTGA